jgi:hypothetical protein
MELPFVHGKAPINGFLYGELSGFFAFQEISKNQIHCALFFISLVSSSGEKNVQVCVTHETH